MQLSDTGQQAKVFNDADNFISIGSLVGLVSQRDFPDFSGLRVMMMPFMMNAVDELPPELDGWYRVIKRMLKHCPEHVEHYEDTPAYLTIDEMVLEPGEIHRKPGGLHVDGINKGKVGGAWGGSSPGGSWGSVGNGMLVASNVSNMTTFYTGIVDGKPKPEGECEHLRDRIGNLGKTTLKAGDIYWADGLCLHEAVPAQARVERQFIRISLPNDGPWYKGYTPNPRVSAPNIVDSVRKHMELKL